eukprot:TRINITY_DN16299_c0_g1_i1.p1 TRINITY_DN16299_c0_g1~~TRINITY_DN16299_c0_g1_i1.p1  ORF type:complete len:1137 (+),score=206.30 TRINITY_DN16299_c0_g1_i1:204-3614(+)
MVAGSPVSSPRSHASRRSLIAIVYVFTWSLIAILVCSYIYSAGAVRSQMTLLKRTAKQSLQNKRERVKRLIRTNDDDIAWLEDMDLPFDDVFMDWSSRLLENRRAEFTCLRDGCLPIGLLATAGIAAFAAGCTVLLLGVAIRACLHWRRTLANKPKLLNVGEQLHQLERRTSDQGPENSVCSVKLWGLIPIASNSANKVALVCFVGSIFGYFSNPDDFFFLFIAAGQVLETGSFRSCGPVLVFASLFCVFESLNARTRSLNDTQINSQLVSVVRQGQEVRIHWQDVQPWELVRLRHGDQPPCDLILVRTVGCTCSAQESGLTGELKAVKKTVMDLPPTATLTMPPSSDTISVSADNRPLPPAQDQHQLFGGTTVGLRAATTMEGSCFVEGRAVRLSLGAKMYRRCEAAAQPASKLSGTMSLVGMMLVFVLVLSAYDNSLTVVLTSNEEYSLPRCLKIFFGNLLYENTMVPMSLKQVVVVAASMQAFWYRLAGVDVNTAWSVIRLGEVAVEADRCIILTDKTGTLTENTMKTRAVAVMDSSNGDWTVFVDKTQGQLVAPTQRHIGMTSPDLLAQELASCEAYLFPEMGDPAPCSEAAQRMYSNWAGCTEEHPGEHPIRVPDCEEASFIQRIPGKLLENLPRNPTTGEDGLVQYTLETNSQEVLQQCRVFATLPFSRELRAKGVILAEDHESFRLVVQGSSSLMAAAMEPNKHVCTRLEEHLMGRVQWKGAVRVWFHAARRLDRAEAENIRAETEQALNEGELTASLMRAYEGCSVCQATAMEDPYQKHVPRVLQELTCAGFHVMMVTGDTETAAEGIANAIGLADTATNPCTLIAARTVRELHEELLAKLRGLRGRCCLMIGTKVTGLLQHCAEQAPPGSVAHGLEAATINLVADLIQRSGSCAVWAQSSVDQKPFIAWFVQHYLGASVLAVGDGINDVGMIEAAHLGVGVRGRESTQAAKAAGLQIGTWAQLGPLLLELGVRSMILISVAVKWVYYKHAMTAFSLQAWLVHRQHSQWTDPTDPLQMMFFNAVAFGVVIAYSVSDQLSSAYLCTFQQRSRGSLFRFSSLIRWWASGGLHGFLITFVIVLCYPEIGQQEFGTTLLCMKCAALSARCWFASNTLGRSGSGLEFELLGLG